MSTVATVAFLGLVLVIVALIICSIVNDIEERRFSRSAVASDRFGERIAMRRSKLNKRALDALKIDEQLAEELQKRFPDRSHPTSDSARVSMR
ncbi:MAG: hypothetical protein JJ979_02615 [Roseibium sp.]|nr:hypothetical protein [Roseibium sp.]